MSHIKAWLLILLGGLFALIAGIEAIALATGDGPTYTDLSVDVLETRGAGQTEWVHVPDGLLYWRASVLSYEENLSGTKREEKGYYVPLVSAGAANALDAQHAADTTLDLSRVRALVFVPIEEADDVFPWLAEGSSELPRTAVPYAVRGRLKPGRATPLHVKRFLTEHYPSLDPGRGVMIEHAEEAHSLAAVGGLAILCLMLMSTGFARRRELAAAYARRQTTPFDGTLALTPR